MATVGQQLTAPEAGWRRYDDTDTRIQYDKNWILYNGGNYFSATQHYANVSGSSVTIKFYGTKIRLLLMDHLFNILRRMELL